MTRHFLVIGGMKCGSTTLYHDLRRCDEIFLARKESDILLDGGAGSAGPSSLEERYREGFARAGSKPLRGEVSTNYSKRPDTSQVAARALQLYGADTKLIYIVREPIDRLISHHYHMHSWRGEGHMSADIDLCVEQHPSLVNYSRYAWQLEPWLECFSASSLRVVVFEDYVKHRQRTIGQLCEFLGVEANTDAIDVHKRYNQSDNKPVLNRSWMRFLNSSIYRKWLRSRLPTPIADSIRGLVLPKAPPRPAAPRPETLERLVSDFRDDVVQLERFCGMSTPWNLERWLTNSPSAVAA